MGAWGPPGSVRVLRLTTPSLVPEQWSRAHIARRSLRVSGVLADCPQLSGASPIAQGLGLWKMMQVNTQSATIFA